MDYKREYCCPECGLIWIQKVNAGAINNIVCPECENQYNYACDTFGYAYAAQSIKENLEKNNKKIHYDKEHPFYNK